MLNFANSPDKIHLTTLILTDQDARQCCTNGYKDLYTLSHLHDCVVSIFRELVPLDQGSTYRLVRAPVGANWCDIFRIYWCWCGAVRVFENFCGAGAVRSGFLKNFWFWCGAVLIFEIFGLLVRCGPRFLGSD